MYVRVCRSVSKCMMRLSSVGRCVRRLEMWYYEVISQYENGVVMVRICLGVVTSIAKGMMGLVRRFPGNSFVDCFG